MCKAQQENAAALIRSFGSPCSQKTFETRGLGSCLVRLPAGQRSIPNVSVNGEALLAKRIEASTGPCGRGRERLRDGVGKGLGKIRVPTLPWTVTMPPRHAKKTDIRSSYALKLPMTGANDLRATCGMVTMCC